MVEHRQLLLPQLAANGVAAHKLKKLCGFRGKFGPILASDIPEYLETEEASEKMREVTFTLKERSVLIPLEIFIVWKPVLLFFLTIFLLSGISPEFFSRASAFTRGTNFIIATGLALLSGAALTPLLLPYLFFRQFWLKGLLVGGVIGAFGINLLLSATPILDKLALFLWIIGGSSYMAMNFTGSTPYTSLSGVATEMRKGLAFQIIVTILAFLCWIISPFIH